MFKLILIALILAGAGINTIAADEGTIHSSGKVTVEHSSGEATVVTAEHLETGTGPGSGTFTGLGYESYSEIVGHVTAEYGILLTHFNLLCWSVLFFGIGAFLLGESYQTVRTARKSNFSIPNPTPGFIFAIALSSLILMIQAEVVRLIVFRLPTAYELPTNWPPLFSLPIASFRILAWAAIPLLFISAYFFLITVLATNFLAKPHDPRIENSSTEKPQDNREQSSFLFALGGFAVSALSIATNVIKIIEFNDN